jgi:ATP-dependent Lhr-like helicase
VPPRPGPTPVQHSAGSKFSEALPRWLAVATLAARLADLEGATTVLGEATRFVRLN